MPKQKTKKSVTARFKITKNGKILRRRSFTSHLKSNKSAKQKRNLRKRIELTGPYAKKVRQLMGVKLK